MTPHRALPPYDWAAVLTLVRAAFAGMEGRIDPPSSLHGLAAAGLEAMAVSGEVWVLGVPPCACMVLTPQKNSLYLGKLAVAPAQQGRGLGRRMVALAETRARALRLPVLELQTRVELVENHAVFTALGFAETGRTAHPGFDHPTSVTFRKTVR